MIAKSNLRFHEDGSDEYPGESDDRQREVQEDYDDFGYHDNGDGTYSQPDTCGD